MRPCDQIRPAFREYSDNELTPEDKSEVDEHVHGCEPCGRLLMQAELEVIRLKQSFQFVEPPPDFTRVAVQRAREELARDQLEGPSMVEAPEDFTANVMKQVLREAGRARGPASESGGSERGDFERGELGRREGEAGERPTRHGAGPLLRLVKHPAVLMPLAAAAALLLVWGLWLRTVRPDGLRLDAGEAIALAPATDGAPYPTAQRLRLGQVLPAGHEVQVAEGRTALLQGAGAFDGIRTVEVQGPARLVLAAAMPQSGDAPRLSLLEGSVRVASSRAVSVITPIPAEIRLAAGVLREGEASAPAEMDVSLREITRHDESLAGGRVFHALRVRVLSGEASVQRGAAPSERIAAAEVAVLDPWAPLRKERVLDAAWLASISLANTGTVADRRSDPGRKEIHGRVVRSTDGLPVGEAVVTLHLGEARHSTKTLHDGTFELVAAGSAWAGLTPFLGVKPPAGSRAGDLHHHAVPPSAEQVVVLGNVEVPGSRSARGRVATTDDRAVAGVRVRVFEHDALFGKSKELEGLAVVTGREGEFELLDLPSGLDAGVEIVLVLDHPEYPLATRFDLCGPAAGHELDLQLPAGRTVALWTSEAPGSPLVVADEPEGIARTWVTRIRERVVESGGVVRVPGWTASARVFAANGQSLVARSVQAIGVGADARFELLPPGTDVIDGRVLARGGPAPMVPVVVAVGSELRAEGVTDAHGRFELRGSFGPGPVFLELGAESFINRVELRESARRNLELAYEPSVGTPGAVPMVAALRHRPSDRPGWTRHGPRIPAEDQGVELRVAVVDQANVGVSGASLFFHALGAPHAVFLGKSAAGLTLRLPAQGRLLATGVGGLLAHHVLASPAGSASGSESQVQLELRAPIRVDGRVHAPGLAGSVPPVVAKTTLADGWVVELARNPDTAGGFALPHVPAGAASQTVDISCGQGTGSFLQAPGSTLKVTVSESQDGLRVARQP